MNVSTPKILEFPQNGNINTGYLSFVEDTSSVPFDIKRVYWIYGIPEMVSRGNHAHKHDEQVIVCINGTADIEIIDQKQQKTYFSLTQASQGLYVPKLYWKNIQLSKGACLLCISSTLYDENGYIKDFNEFICQ